MAILWAISLHSRFIGQVAHLKFVFYMGESDISDAEICLSVGETRISESETCASGTEGVYASCFH